MYVTPMEKLRLELGLERMDKEGEELELNRRLGLTYQFTQRMFVRTTFEVTREDEGERRIFALYGWEFRPEISLYLVYTDNKK